MTDSEGNLVDYVNKEVQLESTGILYVHVQLFDTYNYQVYQ